MMKGEVDQFKRGRPRGKRPRGKRPPFHATRREIIVSAFDPTDEAQLFA